MEKNIVRRPENKYITYKIDAITPITIPKKDKNHVKTVPVVTMSPPLDLRVRVW